MAPQSKRRRVDDKKQERARSDELLTDLTFPHSPSAPATDEDKKKWQGFCEIESDPAFFNVMLKEFGVQGVKVQEVLGLEDELLMMLPKPVYGLIFLFRYKELDVEKQEVTCPDHVWFANQISGNACATVALLNIVNNIPGIELGDHLRTFKDFTRDFNPALRGDQITNFEFVKAIHNSFARKLDMMNIDLHMREEFWARRQKTSQKEAKGYQEEDDAAFHFIAFVPIEGEVWKLDGLDRQPQNLGSIGSNDWLQVVSPTITARMAQYEEGQIEFGLLSLVKDPIIDYRTRLAENIKTLQMIEARLDSSLPDWKTYTTDYGGDGTPADAQTLRQASVLYGITSQLLDEVRPQLPPECDVEDQATKLIEMRGAVIDAQGALKAAIKEEEESARTDAEKASDRRSDYGPAIQAWLRMLADAGVLGDLMQQHR